MLNIESSVLIAQIVRPSEETWTLLQAATICCLQKKICYPAFNLKIFNNNAGGEARNRV